MVRGICPFAEYIPLNASVYGSGGPDKVGICDHTAGGFYTTLRNASFWNNAGYSVHFGISRTGLICQLVNIFDRAWGQGRDSRGMSVSSSSPGISWPPFSQMNYVNPNEYLISIEHEDAITVNGKTQFVPGPTWTTEMYNADLRLKRWIVDEAGPGVLRFGLDSLAGHYMFDPVNRFHCPGTPWKNEYRLRLYQDLTKEDDDMMIPHFGRHPRFNGSAGIPVTGTFPLDITELGVPPNAKMVRLEVFKDPPGYLGIGHGNNSYAGCVMRNGSHGFCDVVPASKLLTIDASWDSTISIWELRIIGYWL